MVTHAGTAADTVARAVALGRALGKTPIVVADSPGFYTSNLGGPFFHTDRVGAEQAVATLERLDRPQPGAFAVPDGLRRRTSGRRTDAAVD